MSFKKIGTVSLLLFLFPFHSLFAQSYSENSPEEELANDISQKENVVPDFDASGLVQCFDYYKFQSVQVSFGATNKDNYQAGETVHFSGKITNLNTYPIAHGYVFARVVKKDSAYTSQGHQIIDEFFLSQDLYLDAQAIREEAFDYAVPTTAETGAYRINFYYSVGKKFSLGGLPFTNEIIVGTAEFQVASSRQGSVFFDRSGTTVNGAPYQHIGNWPTVSENEKVSVVQPIRNTTDRPEKIRVTYDLFRWDSLNEADQIRSTSEEVVVEKKGTGHLTYEIPKLDDTVYYLRITAEGERDKSIVNLRILKTGSHPILTLPAVTHFPLQKGKKETLFACFNNAAYANTKGNVSIGLYDKNGDPITNFSYDGIITGEMLAIAKEFVPEKNYDYFVLKASVADENGVGDQYDAVYDCRTMMPSACENTENAAPFIKGSLSDRLDWPLKTLSVAILIFSTVLMLAFFLGKGKRRYFSVVLFFSIIFPHTALAFNEQTIAQGTPWNYFYDYGGGFTDTVYMFVSVLHRVGMTSGGVSVGIGDAINFYYNPDPPFYNASGYVHTCPYGRWCTPENSSKYSFFDGNGANDGDNFCPNPSPPVNARPYPYFRKAENAFIGTEDWMALYPPTKYSSRWVIATGIKPAVSMTSSNNAVISCSGMNCTASAPGTATLTANIGATPVSLWKHNGHTGKDLRIVRSSSNPTFSAASLSWDVTVAAIVVNGACGSANGVATSTPPTTGLCTVGISTAVSGTGPYTWSCLGSGGGTDASCSAPYAAPSTLKICENACDSSLDRTNQTFVMTQNATKSLKACYNNVVSCSSAAGDVTASATWIDSNSPQNVISFPLNGLLQSNTATGSEDFSVSYSGDTKTATAQIFCIPLTCISAKAVTDTYCPEETRDTSISDNCGSSLICPGTRYCDTNYREVSP